MSVLPLKLSSEKPCESCSSAYSAKAPSNSSGTETATVSSGSAVVSQPKPARNSRRASLPAISCYADFAAGTARESRTRAAAKITVAAASATIRAYFAAFLTLNVNTNIPFSPSVKYYAAFCAVIT